MDPIITAPLLALALQKVVDSMASETGKRMWDALTALLKRAHRPEADTAEGSAEASVPTTDVELQQLVTRLLGLAATNPRWAAELRAWADAVTGAESGTTSNTISGTVHGNAVQARDISGPITFN